MIHSSRVGLARLSAALVLSFAICSCQQNDFASYVNLFSGTDGNGHCHPCACLPFGAVQVGPQTGNFAWEYCGGYQWRDTLIMGFSHNRIDGTGSSELGDLLMMPFTGEVVKDDYRSHFDKGSEIAVPGYYSCVLDDYGIRAEMSCTPHVAIHRYSAPADEPLRMMIDLQSAQIGSQERMFKRVEDCWQDWSDPCHVRGYTHSKAWNDREIYYDIEFSRPYEIVAELPLRDEREKIARRVLDFGASSEPLMVKASISIESAEGASSNILAELPGWDFERVRTAARENWNEHLGRIEIQGSEEEKYIFYTAMYHLMMHPNNIADCGEKAFYSTLSLWDTYRAAHPLYTLIAPEIVGDVVNSFMRYYEQQGFLPMWALGGTDNYGMIGNHSIPVIVDAYLKGFGGFDAEAEYEAMKRSVTEDHIKYDWGAYDACGYFPYDVTLVESVSRTLECCYDDWCISQMAGRLGRQEDSLFFAGRSQYYRNVFDPSYRLMRARNSKGEWQTPFDPLLIGHFRTGGAFTEGNSWQYSWHVQHDVDGLVELMGGREAFVEKLDSLFSISAEIRGTGATVDVSGMIGQYAHGNEPSHHVTYLYSLAGEREKAAKLIREIWQTQYLNGPDGLSGNDDCGQMSAWYIFSALGFYPVNPCGGEYVLGAAQLPKMVVHLPNGKTLTVRAHGPLDGVPSEVRFNGIPVDGVKISHETLLEGGVLAFYFN